MEKLSFHFKNGRLPIPKRKILVGVVSSGNLEVLVEPIPMQHDSEIIVNTTVSGFATIWKAVLTDFYENNPHSNMRITINDLGATPAVVRLRLDQAIAMARVE